MDVQRRAIIFIILFTQFLYIHYLRFFLSIIFTINVLSHINKKGGTAALPFFLLSSILSSTGVRHLCVIWDE